MSDARGTGRLGFAWSRWDERVISDFAQFAARNFYQVRGAYPQNFSWQSGSTRAYAAEGFTLIHAGASGPEHSGYCEVRDRDMIASDACDQYALVLQIASSRTIRQLGRTQVVEPGQSAFFCTAEPYEGESAIARDRSEMVAFYMPSTYVNERLVEPKRFCARENSGPLGAMAFDMVRAFAANAWHLDPVQFLQAARIVADMVLAGRDGSAPGLGDKANARVTALTQVKRVIARRLGEADVMLADIAAEAGFSLNYLHKLFRTEDMTLAAFVKTERLRAAYGMLELAGAQGMSVTDVALTCGFSDSSFFSRSFRQAYGITPRVAMQRSASPPTHP